MREAKRRKKAPIKGKEDKNFGFLRSVSILERTPEK
jgi:hypothetical protein